MILATLSRTVGCAEGDKFRYLLILNYTNVVPVTTTNGDKTQLICIHIIRKWLVVHCGYRMENYCWLADVAKFTMQTGYYEVANSQEEIKWTGETSFKNPLPSEVAVVHANGH